MGIKTKEVERIAELAHLELTPEELEPFVKHFQEILDYFQQLKEVETEGVHSMNHALQQLRKETRMREDTVGESFSSETAVREAPSASEGQFRVPKVIE